MNTSASPSRLEKILRWFARIWSLLALYAALAVIFTPDPYATEPVPPQDWFLLGLWNIAILGLLIAWRWERTGALITIFALFLREFSYFSLKGGWHTYFLIFWAGVLPPALMFLAAWKMKQNRTNHDPG